MAGIRTLECHARTKAPNLGSYHMERYHLAIFDFDGTLADSLPWFRSEIHNVIARFDLAPLDVDEMERLRALSGQEILAKLKVPLWKLPAIVDDMRCRKLAAADKISLFDGIPALLCNLHDVGIKTAVVSSDSEESVRRGLGPAQTGYPASIVGLRSSASTENLVASRDGSA